MNVPKARILLVLAILAPAAVRAQSTWHWPARFTSGTDPGLESLHSEIHRMRLSADTPGFRVQNLKFRAPFFEATLVEGTLFVEAPIEGFAAGAWFEGDARVTFDPEWRNARADLRERLGVEALREVPVGGLYLFSLSDGSAGPVAGTTGEAVVPWEGSRAYEAAKQALRMTGLRLAHAFLNRAGRSNGASFVVFAPETIRSGAPDAHLLYAHDPDDEYDVQLDVFGHPEAIFDSDARRYLSLDPSLRYYFWSVARARTTEGGFAPHGRGERYASRVTVPKNLRSAEVETTITFKPGAGITGLLLEITPRLEVLSVRDPAGEQLPFAQWAFASERWNPDASLLVRFSDPLPAGTPVSITVAAKGPLFDPFLGGTQQAEEDLWQPRLDDPEGAVHELRCVVPKHTKVAGSGRLLSETVVGPERHVHFETSRPVNHASFYLGPFESYTAKADDTEVELLANYYKDEIADVFGDGTSRPITGENPEYAVQEIANAVRIYNRMLGVRLETPHLRVATTPTGHGRGFDGLILLSKYLGTSGDLSRADLFRAHEVAHQWFGGIVMSKNWPEDRWLTESFAEFVAMEFYDARFQKRDKTMALLKDAWLDPLFMETPSPVRTLTGQTVSMKEGGRRLIDGGQNVYTKGPLVLRHLRYLFMVQKKGDEAFWALLKEFLESHRYGRVSTADFVAAAERKMGGKLGWFWDQWVYGSGFPKIKWSHEVSPHPQGGYLLTVQATQEATEFILPIPVHVHMGGDKVLTTHLAMRGKEGKLQVRLKERPKKVTLNDDWMAPVEILN